MAYFSYINYSLPSPAPKPLQRQCAYVINPRSVQNSPLGNPNKLEEILNSLGSEVYYTEDAIGYKDLGALKWLAFFAFEYLPKSLVFERVGDPYGLLDNKPCNPLASDIPIILSLWKWDIPSYSFVLSNRKNLQHLDNCQKPKEGAFLPYVGKGGIGVYAYSSKGFVFPGEEVKLPAVLVIDLFEKKSLVLLTKDGKLYKVYDQRSIREPLEEAGIYELYAYTYRYRLWRFYFGLRFLSCSPKLQAI
ncbi:MAG: hypothetical protein ACK4OF_06535 [Aquificaceae bacterium]